MIELFEDLPFSRSRFEIYHSLFKRELPIILLLIILFCCIFKQKRNAHLQDVA